MSSIAGGLGTASCRTAEGVTVLLLSRVLWGMSFISRITPWRDRMRRR